MLTLHRTLRPLAVAILIALAAAGVLLAQKGAHISGVVVSVDPKADAVTIQDGKQTTVIGLTKTTKYVNAEKKAAAITDLKTGLRVVVEVQTDKKTNMYTADRVDIIAAVSAGAQTASKQDCDGAQSALKARLATIAPTGSIWDQGLAELASAVKCGTKSRVTMDIFSGGSQGSEKQVVESMDNNSGAVNTALLTQPGLAQIDDAFNVFGLPFFFESDAEMWHVRDKLTPLLAQVLEKRNYHLLAWGEGGWVRLFSKQPIKTLAELKKAKLYTSEGNDKFLQWYKDNEFHPVAMPETEILKQLKAINGIDVVPIPPYPAQLLGVYRDAPNMLEIQVAPLVGAAIITSGSWKKLSEADRGEMTKAAKAMEAKFKTDVPKNDRESIARMQTEGYDLKITKVDSKFLKEFSEEAARMTKAASALVPKVVFDLALQERDAYRKAQSAKR